MQKNCRRTSPAISSRIRSFSFAANRKGRTCAVESLSHIAGMSPVITCTVPSSCIFIVVSSVLRMQRSNCMNSPASASVRISASFLTFFRNPSRISLLIIPIFLFSICELILHLYIIQNHIFCSQWKIYRNRLEISHISKEKLYIFLDRANPRDTEFILQHLRHIRT